MADAHLSLRYRLRRKCSQRARKKRSDRSRSRSLPRGLVSDAAFHFAAKVLHELAVVDQGDDADESGCAIFDTAELFQQPVR